MLCLLAAAASSTRDDVLVTLNSPAYSSNVRPGEGTGFADKVRVQLAVQHVGKFSTSSHSYQLEGFMRLWWHDERLAFGNASSPDLVLKSASALWTPDIYLENAVSVDLGDGHHGELVRISYDGSVWWSRQSLIELRCFMGFGKQPFDTQNCLFLLGIYSNLAHEVFIEWADGAGQAGLHEPMGSSFNSQIDHDAAVYKGWDLTHIKAYNIVDVYPSGNYSYTKACLTFRRLSSSDSMNIVMAIIFVVLSYLGFWINPSAAPARVALAVVMVLVVSSNYSAVDGHLGVSYSVFLRDFLFGCFCFNVFAFASYALTNFGMYVHGQLNAVKLSRIQDMDSDGVLDWRELRRAQETVTIAELKAAHLKAQTLRSGAIGTSSRAKISPDKPNLPVPGKDDGGDPDAEPVQAQPVRAQLAQAPSGANPSSQSVRPPMLRGKTSFGPDRLAKKYHRCVHAFTDLFKPESVQEWRNWDREMRWYFPPAFITYCVVMFACLASWPDNLPAVTNAVEICETPE